MSAIRDLWSLLRGGRSRFGPGGPAGCDVPASARRRTFAGAVEEAQGRDAAPAAVPAPSLPLLLAGGEKLLQAARALGRTPALAVMHIDDLPELEAVFGRAGVDRVMQAALSGLTAAAAGHGLAVRTAAGTFALLFPGGGAGAALAALQARFGTPCTIDIGLGPDEILVVPEVMVHPLGRDDAIAQVYDDLCRYIAKARRQRQRTRAGVAQPAACGSVAAESPLDRPALAPVPAPQYWPPVPATIPVPLRSR